MEGLYLLGGKSAGVNCLESIYRQALKAADPFAVTGEHLDGWGDGPVRLMAAGKAAVPMARAVLEKCPVSKGILVTKTGHLENFENPLVETLEASHPEPDERSLEAGERFLAFAGESSEPIVFCLSGGASSLLAAPIEGLSLAQLKELNRVLLNGGIPIEEMNLVRKRLSRLKGGGLAQVMRVPCLTLILSDVVGGGPHMVASGPTLNDRDGDPQEVLQRYGLELPQGVTFRSSLPPFEPDYRVVADNQSFALAAIAAAEATGWAVQRGSLQRTGAVEELLPELRERAQALQSRELFVESGEWTAVIPPDGGLGGRCQHLALMLAREFQGQDLMALVGASDGTDGPTDLAGAWVDGDTWSQPAQRALEEFDSYSFFKGHGGALRTGPTGTNVNDLILLARP